MRFPFAILPFSVHNWTALFVEVEDFQGHERLANTTSGTQILSYDNLNFRASLPHGKMVLNDGEANNHCRYSFFETYHNLFVKYIYE